jgi:hypothetical protein
MNHPWAKLVELTFYNRKRKSVQALPHSIKVMYFDGGLPGAVKQPAILTKTLG